MRRMKANFEDEDWLDKLADACLQSLFVICILVGILIFGMLFGSCKTTKVIETVAVHDTVTINNTQRDSIFVRDSIFHEIVRQGDTVFDTRYVLQTRYKDRLQHDSIYISKTDTVYKNVEVTKQLTPGHLLKDTILTILAIVGMVSIIYYAFRNFIKKHE